MRLWQKISILCVLVLLLVIVTCSVLLLQYSRDSILDLSVEQAESEQANLQKSFENMASYYLEDGDNPTAKQAVVKYCFSQFANETSVLVEDGETIYSQISVDPAEYLQAEYKQNTWQGKVSSRNILIVGSNVTIDTDSYDIYVVKDITPVYARISEMIWRFILICGGGIAAGAFLIIFIVRRASRPLEDLRKKTRLIAGGNYAERSEVKTKDEIGELSADFNTMATAVETHIAKLEDTAQRQRLLLGGLTHEFKTPMTSLILHSETLLTTDLPKEDAENALVHINTQCKWLESLTQKMLRLIMLEGQISKRKEPVADLLEDVRESTEAVLEKRRTPLTACCSTDTLEMDYDLMKSLLINLVDNASKASDAGQLVSLQAYDATIEVADHGAGIPQDEIDKVTDAFYMIDRSRSKAKGGSGLGLALVKRIADTHGARLVIESEVGKGTTIKIIFPR